MKRIIVCTLCPNGCEVEAEYTDRQNVSISGNRCDRGYEYTINECFDPRRTFTGSVDITGTGRRRMPVRSNKPIPKDSMLACAEQLKKIRLEAPVSAGYVVLHNIFDSGADIVTTMGMRKEL